MKKIFLVIFIMLVCSALTAVELKLIDTVTLHGGGKDDFIKAGSYFAVTEDNLYLILDQKEGDIKVFDVKGRFVKRVGRKGHGPGEFINPRGCDYLDRHFVVLDLDRRIYMLLTRDNESILKESEILRSIYMGNDVALMKDEKLLLAGYKPDKDGKEWGLFTYDFKNKHFDYLVPEEIKYGLESVSAYKAAREDIAAIGSSGYCAWWGDYAYLAWIGDLKVFKINLKSKKIQTFGKKTGNYLKPVATEQLKKALREQDVQALNKESEKFSYLLGIFSNRNYLLLTYEKPIAKGDKAQSRMLQFYTLDGTFINELQITREAGCALHLSKDLDNDILYMLQSTYVDHDETEEIYEISRFKMIR